MESLGMHVNLWRFNCLGWSSLDSCNIPCLGHCLTNFNSMGGRGEDKFSEEGGGATFSGDPNCCQLHGWL
jgi:hypothetical protein